MPTKNTNIFPDEFATYEDFVKWVKSELGECSEEVLRAIWTDFYPQ